MTCEEIQDKLLTDYYDGELSEDERERIDQHLRECASCSVFFEKVRETNAALTTSEERPDVSPQVWQKIAQRIDEEEGDSLVNLWQRILEGLPSSRVLVPVMVSIVAVFFIVHQVLVPKGLDPKLAASYYEESLYTFSLNGDTDEPINFDSDLEMYFL